MKSLRQSMSWMHTWTGLLLGWILYFMFLTGSAGYYDTEIDRWMKPEQPAPVDITGDGSALFQMGIDYASAQAPQADSYFVIVPTNRTYSPYVSVGWQGTDEGGERVSGRAQLTADGQIVPDPRDTGGGQSLYQMHWTFHYIPRALGEFIAGLAAFFMFAAILSGIITHKKIIADFFTLRLSKGQRSWLDSHNVLSVMTLPYQIMITYSGLLFVGTLFFAPIIVAQYGVSEDARDALIEEVFGIGDEPERTGEAMDLTPIAPLIVEARKSFPNEPVSRLTVTNPGDATAHIQVFGTISEAIQRKAPSVTFNGVTGERLEEYPRGIASALDVIDTFEGLHEALFAGPILRVLFFLSGLLGGGMVATGLVLWTKKRRQKLSPGMSASKSLLVIERLNVGVVAGLPLGIAAYFWANRLLPLNLAGRADWEIHVIFLTWAAALTHSLIRGPKNAWVEQLAAAAALFILIPILNALTTDIHLGNTLPLPGRPGDWVLAGVDLWMVIIGAGIAYAARIASQKTQASPAAAKRTPSARRGRPLPPPQLAE